MDMKDRIVFITGAKGGLGSVITETFLKQGAQVIGASRSISSNDFPEPNFEPMVIDFTNAEQVRGAVGKIIAKHGRIDVVVHVVGGFDGGQTIATTTDSTWNHMRDMNLTSAFHVLRETVPHLRKSKSARIIAIGSLTAKEPHANLGAYVIFKSALTTLVQTVAVENADCGLTANVVMPGTMDTAANRQAMPNESFSKWVQLQDVAELVLWLAGEEASHLTGMAIPIEGKHG
jgi:NAD(P)-dependent dehydrogenase (short-subunit alcohol dehydrogenase family)